jgi:protein CpxP
MNKILILLAALTLSASAASAQTAVKKAKIKTESAKTPKHAAKTPEQQADHFTQHLTQKLALSADQAQRVRQLNLAYQQEQQALKSKYATNHKSPARHQETKAAKARFETQLQQVLTTDQAAKYAQLREEKMQKHGKGKEKLKAKS